MNIVNRNNLLENTIITLGYFITSQMGRPIVVTIHSSQ